ncbi:T9SS type A sorting domain-containing protein [Carboxylicivirga sediminis]|uniref:T9SS type A sorting domain-containing protein n=1 Tax=Carboxylicivirga sediminis TaxID=2006564 RepID=A0A941F1F4_9BACT|nr:T9SS type A sorting domain-containing protein [Carboxylicivirga sediminis]MBR8534040.1 T9SS type A sorting domain-containing protein [Carboxylicivirga sediminis]
MFSKRYITGLALLIIGWSLYAQTYDKVVVDVNLDMKHTVGDNSEFDRSKFVCIHADITEQEWDGDNELADLRSDFLKGYDVYMGRNTGGITWWLNNQISEDASRPGFANPTSITNKGDYVKNQFASKTSLHVFEQYNDQVMCAQLHPFWPDGQNTQLGWAFSQTDTETEPFGTATGEYMGRFIRDFFGAGGVTGQKRPNYVEVINEPLWHLVDYGNEQPEKVFRFHNAVADEIKKYNDIIEVGGYCVAFPDLEKNNFQQWEERWKLFMDIAGEKMDFWSMHFYDFPAFNGKQRYRKGAQMEATLDMIEQYSYLKFGVAKPFLVSEFGAQMHDFDSEWTPYRDWLHMKSVNTMMLQFMARPNLMTKAINFLPVKAEWGYDASKNQAYNHRLMRKANEPASYSGQWVYTDMVKTYQLWSDVKGTRVDSRPNHQDIISDCYVYGNRAYIIVNSLDLEKKFNVELNFEGIAQVPAEVNVKHLYLSNNQPVLDAETHAQIPGLFEIGIEGTLIVECVYPQDIAVSETSDETKYYATELLKPIVANADIEYSFNNIEAVTEGEAILRIGIGRALDKEVYPTVLFNGTKVNVEANYRGDDQLQRESFFGLLEVEVPVDLLQSINTVTLQFPDNGGYVSSVAMQVYEFSRKVNRSGRYVGLPSISASQFRLSPNPASGKFLVQTTHSQVQGVIELYDISGRMLLNQPIMSQQQYITVSHLKRGVYVAVIKEGEERYSQKLVIE